MVRTPNRARQARAPGAVRTQRAAVDAGSTPRERRRLAGAKIGLSRLRLVFVYLISLGLVSIAIFVVVTDVPIAGLVAQHQQLDQAAAELSSSTKQVAQLRAVITALQTPAEIALLAHRDFNLVEPGQRSFLIVPPPGESSLDQPLPKRLPAQAGLSAGSIDATVLGGTSSSAAIGARNTSSAGSPASTGSAAMPPGAISSAASTAKSASGLLASSVDQVRAGTGARGPGSAHPRNGPSSFWSRVLRDLEFWRS